jgi:hypothetical protein
MKKYIVFILLVVLSLSAFGQVRNGWRSVFDKEGRLTRMHFYDNGISIIDSSFFFQYYTENVLKALINGEIKSNSGQLDGSIALFDRSGRLTSYSIKEQGANLFDVECDYEENCMALLSEGFEHKSENWEGKDVRFYQDNLLLRNNDEYATAEYKPPYSFKLGRPFALKFVLPVKDNVERLGVSLGWESMDNCYLIEFSEGKYYNVNHRKDGKNQLLTDAKAEIDYPNPQFNVVVIRNDGSNIILEVNSTIEEVLPIPDFMTNNITLFTKSKGDALFSEMLYRFDMCYDNDFFDALWIGKGTGFFIGKNKVLTTYDVIYEAKRLRITGKIGDQTFHLPVRLGFHDEKKNIAVLRVDSIPFLPFERLPFGYSSTAPVSGSEVYSLGFPNAVSGIYISPEVYTGNVLPSMSHSAGSSLIEMSYRYGMNGAPVFDNDANLVGVYSRRGIDLKYTEIVDFQDNERTMKAELGRFERKLDSPYKNEPREKQLKELSDIVVIVESSVFDKK